MFATLFALGKLESAAGNLAGFVARFYWRISIILKIIEYSYHVCHI